MPENIQMVAEAMLAAWAESANTNDLAGLLDLCWLEDERFAMILDRGALSLDAIHPGGQLRWSRATCYPRAKRPRLLARAPIGSALTRHI